MQLFAAFKSRLRTEDLERFETRFAEGDEGTGEHDATEKFWKSYSVVRRCVYTDRLGASANASSNYTNDAVTVNERDNTLDHNDTSILPHANALSSSFNLNDTAALNEVFADSFVQYADSFSDTSNNLRA